MTAVELLPILTLGALLGAVGQVLRSIAGLKKLKEDPAGKFDPMQLLMSVIIGAAAGVIAMVTLEMTSSKSISTQDIITVIAAGYTGADFIEAFMTKNMSAGGGLPQQRAAPVALIGNSPNPNFPTPNTLIASVSAAGPIPPVGADGSANNPVG